MRESSVSDKSILSPVRSARSQIIKTNERDRRQNEELAHTKNALLQAQSKNTTMATIAEKWKRRAFEAERTCREVTEREHKARTQYESQLQAKEKAYHQLSEESKETIQHLEDINKKLKKENTLLKVKERMTHGANTHAPPAVVEKPTPPPKTPPPLYESRTKSDALLFSINDTVRAIEDELRSHRRQAGEETAHALYYRGKTPAPQSSTPFNHYATSDPVGGTPPTRAPHQSLLRHLDHETKYPRLQSDPNKTLASSRPPRSRTFDHLSRKPPALMKKRASQPHPTPISPFFSSRHLSSEPPSPSTPGFSQSPSTSSSYSSYASSEVDVNISHASSLPPWHCAQAVGNIPKDEAFSCSSIEASPLPLSHQLRDSILNSLLSRPL